MKSKKDKDRPVSFWIEKERVENKILNCLTVILRTKGCSWSKCLMCGFHAEKCDTNSENLLNQLNYAISSHENFGVLKIFTSGSFFDDREVPPEVRDYIYNLIEKMNLRKLIVESRPEFILKTNLPELNFELEVGIGLETSNDFIRENCINKGFSFRDFKKSAKKLKSFGIRVRTYLLLKPPFISEKEAIEDCITSARDVFEFTDTISINPVYVPKDTYLEKLWKAKLYRPPWLWSALEVLKTIKIENKNINLICDPVGAGSKRAIHNCGRCDKEIARSIKKFSITQNLEDLVEIDCKCYGLWEKAVEFEHVCRFPVVE